MTTKIATYENNELTHIAFPLGGIGAGMFCIQGNGTLGSFSLRNSPDLGNEPTIFSAICVKNSTGNIAKVLEGQIPYHKIFNINGQGMNCAGNGLAGKSYGLPRFKENDFTAKFPFAILNLKDDTLPLSVLVTGFSPFTPLDADSSSNPIASLEYTFENNTNETVDAVYYLSAHNFMHFGGNQEKFVPEFKAKVFKKGNGFILHQPALMEMPYAQGDFYVEIDDENVKVNTDWFEGGWWDVLTMQWNDIKAGRVRDEHREDNLSKGGTIAVEFSLKPSQSKKITAKFAWFVPNTNLRAGYEENKKNSCCCNESATCKPTHKPWYTKKFHNVEEVMEYFSQNYEALYNTSKKFSDTFYNSSLPKEILDAASANLSILKSPTVLRQTDGRIWAWEGCCDCIGCCDGSCTHVWNYAQSMCHLFPELERNLRQTEFNECQTEDGYQTFRAPLPIRKSGLYTPFAASDGQLGGIIKMYREWQIYGDSDWLICYWDKMVNSINYCINIWDKKREGVLKEPHHNTYDIEFWGADAMCSSFYLGALKAMYLMGTFLGKDVLAYNELYLKGKAYLEHKLFNGEYFYQEIEWETLEANFEIPTDNKKCAELLAKEGPKYQYGKGCLSDGVIGAWLSKICGLGDVLDPDKVKKHLLSIYKYNFKASLLDHSNPQRPGYAVGDEGGLLLCTWPRGEKPSLPFVYSDEVWTGIEYQVASHLISFGFVEEGIDIVAACRDRYNGTKRNPFNEYECGHWYARAMSSYSLIQAITGVRYDAISKTLYLSNLNLSDFTSFICTNTGYGTVIVKGSEVVLDVMNGFINIDKIIFE